MPITDGQSKQVLQAYTPEAIENRIGLLKDYIQLCQQEIVFLTLMRSVVDTTAQARNISRRKADREIQDALDYANRGSPPKQIGVNSEGAIN